MFKKFSTQSLRILVVENSSNRSLIVEHLKSMNIGEVQGLASLRDAMNMMETEDFDWILTGVMQDDEVNALQFLKTITKVPTIKNVKVSIFIEQSEMTLLPYAFELGAMAYHTKPLTKDSLKASIDEFLKTAEKCEYNATFIAASYIREILRESQQHQNWLEFEKDLLELYTAHPPLLLYMAEAQFHNGLKEECKTTLRQVALLEPEMAEQSDCLMKNYFPNETLVDNDVELVKNNLLGINKVVYVDCDGTAVEELRSCFGSIGVQNMEYFQDTSSALRYLESNKDVDLIVQEWQLDELSGPAFLQRVKYELQLDAPVLVLSSMLTKDDRALVKELNVSQVVNKPINNKEFSRSVVSAIQQRKHPTEARTFEMMIQDCLRKDDLAEARKHLVRYLDHPEVSESSKLSYKGLTNFHAGNYKIAREQVLDAIKHSGDSIFTLNLLGKIFLKSNDYKHAIQCFEKADRIAPNNIERICTIAEMYSTDGKIDAAEIRLEEAKDIDKEAKIVKETEFKVAFDKGNAEEAKTLMSTIHPIDNLIAFMNNRAVALAKVDKIDESIEEYKKAVASVPDDRPQYRAIIRYNLALSYAKHGELEDSVNLLNAVIAEGPSKVLKRAHSLKKRVEDCLKTDEPLVLKTRSSCDQEGAETEKADGAEVFVDIAAALAVQRGDICCFLIYSHDGEPDPRATRMLEKTPRFKHRDSIEREESFGEHKERKAG